MAAYHHAGFLADHRIAGAQHVLRPGSQRLSKRRRPDLPHGFAHQRARVGLVQEPGVGVIGQDIVAFAVGDVDRVGQTIEQDIKKVVFMGQLVLGLDALADFRLELRVGLG